MSKLNLRGNLGASQSVDVQLLFGLQSQMADIAAPDETVGRLVYASESIAPADEARLVRRSDELQTTLQAVASRFSGIFGASNGLTFAAESAAVAGALAASDPRGYAGRDLGDLKQHRGRSGEVFEVTSGSVPNYLGRRVAVAEAFDNRETRSAVLYTMAYNYTMARQDQFGETVWPTLTLPADQIGFGIVVNRLTIMRGWTHGSDGKPVDAKKIDLMRAEADHTVLRRDRTRLFPVARANNANKLIDASLVAPYPYDNEGEVITTAPYRVGEKINYLGMSQTDAHLAVGNSTERESIDPAMSLEKLYVKFGDDVVPFSVYSVPGANFTYAPQGIDKLRVLNFNTEGLRITPKSTQADKSALVSLGDLVTGNYTAVVRVAVSGTANPEFGEGEVFHGAVRLVRLVDEDGVALAEVHPDFVALAAVINAGRVEGYDLRAYKTNLSMRERGDFIDRTNFTQLYEVPLLSPITAQRPQNTDGSLDAGDFEALVTATRYRLKNDAVTAILESVQRLDEFDISGVTGDDVPAALGAARYHVRPKFMAYDLNVAATINSLKSSEAVADLRANIVNRLRDIAFTLHVESEYQAAATALGLPENPEIIIATDPYIEKWLMIDGELRTLTEKFKLRIVSTLDERFKGKIFMTFGVFDDNRNQAPCILNWGNLIWRPEVVMHASVPRAQHMARETIVQPSYLFVNHLPICAMIQVSGIPDVFNRIPLLLQTTTPLDVAVLP